MEPTAVWVPCDFQLANWAMEPEVWAPGFPVDYASTEIFGSCLQTSVVPCSNGGQLVEYAAATQNDPAEKAAQEEFVVDFHSMEMKIHCDPIRMFDNVEHEFQVDIDMAKTKMHRYPASITRGDVDKKYTVPRMVAIGPYHHGLDHLKKAEELKHVAARYCIKESGNLLQEMYNVVVSVADEARRLYDKDVVEGICDNDFQPMMFFDACFLVQYMLMNTGTGFEKMDPSFCSYIDANDEDIFHDLMLLENQLPWLVVEAVLEFMPPELLDWERFVDGLKGCLQDRKDNQENSAVVLDASYKPPHLLGLLRFYIVGRSSTTDQAEIDQAETDKPETDQPKADQPETDSISFSVSAIELAEIGITLKPSERTDLVDMGVKKKGTLFPELSLAPLSLNEMRASLLVNMAAFELCTTLIFPDAKDEDSAVCSYLLLFAMLVDREEDVHELRTKRLLQGGGGLTNKQVLDFFTSFQDLRLGSLYVRTMEDIEDYKVNWPIRTEAYAIVYRNKKFIGKAIAVIGTLGGFLGTLKSILKGH